MRATGVGAALTLCLPIAAAAVASEPGPAVPGTRSWTTVEPDETEIEVTVGRATEPAIRPDPGEVVVTETATAVTTYTGVTRSCVETVTAEKPTTWDGNARSIVTGKRSAGCTGSQPFTGAILTGTKEQAMKNNPPVTASMQVSFGVTKACKGSSSTSWRGGAFFGYSGNYTHSASVTLACNP
jgi:hypothetical protein